MDTLILEREGAIRLSIFLSIFTAMALWEVFAPRRTQVLSRSKRWLANLGLLAVDVIAVRLVFPVAAVGIAAFAQSRDWGFFNNVETIGAVSVLICIAVLDLAIYFQHVVTHHIPVLWRLHRVHHADADFDVTTAIRFHPVEILLSMGFKAVLIFALGPPMLAIIIFEVLLNGTALFNHANVRIPTSVDHVLRLFVVTPDMHRVHHSIRRRESNRNFGFNLAVWDRLFGTYQAQPVDGHADMTVGMPLARGHHTCVGLPAMLTLPFRNPHADGGTQEQLET